MLEVLIQRVLEAASRVPDVMGKSSDHGFGGLFRSSSFWSFRFRVQRFEGVGFRD